MGFPCVKMDSYGFEMDLMVYGWMDGSKKSQKSRNMESMCTRSIGPSPSQPETLQTPK